MAVASSQKFSRLTVSDYLSKFKWNCTLPKVKGEQNMGPLQVFAKKKNRRGTLEGEVHRCMSFGMRSTSASGMLRGQGADFMRVNPFWSIRSSGLLR